MDTKQQLKSRCDQMAFAENPPQPCFASFETKHKKKWWLLGMRTSRPVITSLQIISRLDGLGRHQLVTDVVFCYWRRICQSVEAWLIPDNLLIMIYQTRNVKEAEVELDMSQSPMDTWNE